MQNLLSNVLVTRVINRSAGTASATPTKGTIIDMQGWDGVLFVAAFDNVAATSAMALRAAGDDVNNTSGMTLYTGSASFTAGASDADNKLLALDVYRPKDRYIEAQVFHVTADAPIDSVIAIQYRGTLKPVTQGATVVASASIAGES